MNKERDNNAHDGVERGPFGDDYLWNRSGPVDPQVEQLERLLSPYALRDTVQVPAAGVMATPRKRWLRAMALAAVLGCLMLGGYGWYWQRLQWPEGGGWDTALVAGQAMLDGRSLRDANAALQPGSVIETDAKGVAKIDVARIGEVVLGNDSRLRLVQTGAGRHRVQLDRGTLWARIWAPPGSFGVGVPSGDAYDLGCEFMISIDAAGNGELQVRSGWVQFEQANVEVLVPQGAQVALHALRAPGTPHARDAAPAFVMALQEIDAKQGLQVADAERRLLEASRPQDAITLVSLLARYPSMRTGAVFDRAAMLLPPGVTREALATQGPHALEPWWRALPYPPMKRWWLQWPDAIPAPTNAQSRLRYDKP